MAALTSSNTSEGCLPLIDNPPIDLSLLLSSSEELGKLHSALDSWGCAQIVNHGISSSLLDKLQELSKQFFALPSDEKEKYSTKENTVEGYGSDDTLRLHLQVHPQHMRQLQFWPEKPQNFGTILHEFSEKTRTILETLLRGVGRALKMEENSFLKLWNSDEDHLHARLNYHPQSLEVEEDVVAHIPHGDGDVISILLQDKEVEALQVLKDDKWFRVPLIPNALVIIVGDQMEITSNGLYESPTHRAVQNPQKERLSIVMLSIPNPDKEIGPLEELISDERPQLYKRLKDYGTFYVQQMTMYKGEKDREINAVKINY